MQWTVRRPPIYRRGPHVPRVTYAARLGRTCAGAELREILSRFGPSLQELDLTLKHLEGCAIVQDDFATNDNSNPHGKFVTDRVKQFASLKAQDHRREIAEIKQRKAERQEEIDGILAELESLEQLKLVP